MVRSDEDMDLIHCLRRHVEALAEETRVRERVASSLGRTVLVTQKRCGDLEQRSVSLESSNAQLRHALELAEAQLQEACHRAQTLETGAKDREDLSVKLLAMKALEEQVSSLKSENASLASQMADWKSKVKEALKEGKKREQQLTSAAITTQTEMKQLQEKLNEAVFQLEAAAAMQSKQRSSKETQTANVEGGEGVMLGSSYAGSPLAAEGSMSIGARRRRSMVYRGEGRERAGSSTFSPTILPPGLLVSAPPDQRTLSPGPPLPLKGDGQGLARSESPLPLMLPGTSFPHPLPPLNPHQQDQLHSPKRLDDLPDVPPFIVTVHFSTPGGWSIDAKQRVPRGLTVEGLMLQCARQFSDRYQQDIQVDHMCIRMNHEKAKRSVILHRDRELHSFAIFQRYQREGTPIVLFLAPRDDMQEYVQLKLQQRLAEELS